MSTAETEEETANHQTAPSKESKATTTRLAATCPLTEETEETTVATTSETTVATTSEATEAHLAKHWMAATAEATAMIRLAETEEEAKSCEENETETATCPTVASVWTGETVEATVNTTRLVAEAGSAQPLLAAMEDSTAMTSQAEPEGVAGSEWMHHPMMSSSWRLCQLEPDNTTVGAGNRKLTSDACSDEGLPFCTAYSAWLRRRNNTWMGEKPIKDLVRRKRITSLNCDREWRSVEEGAGAREHTGRCVKLGHTVRKKPCR
eukprot:6214502-Pleurochrysis_carterae.AAC.1